MSSTVQQSRSCLFQILWAGIQLLNSVNPIAAHVCKARDVRATGRKAAVSLHAMMDTSLLVLTLILASQQCGLAKAVGSMLSFPLESLFRNLPTVVDNLSAQRMASSSEVAPVEAKEASRQMVCSIMGKDIPAVAAGVLQTVHDYVAVSPRVFGLRPSRGWSSSAAPPSSWPRSCGRRGSSCPRWPASTRGSAGPSSCWPPWTRCTWRSYARTSQATCVCAAAS
ncbi:unnamed protein product [Effrenium voratum]|nr:unnamed protein product [Effrenium voratum]